MKTVIFDMDGTIVDSGKAICMTVNEMRRRMGLYDDLEEEFIVKAINNPKRNVVLEFYGLQKVDEKLKYEFEKEFIKNYNLYSVLYDGVEDLFIKCKENGYFVSLASNAPAATLEAILEKNKVLGYFDLVVGADNKIPQKPDPAMLFKVIETGKNKKTIFIGDSIKDEEAAMNAKIPYLQVTWGFGDRSLKNLNADTPEKAWEIINNL